MQKLFMMCAAVSALLANGLGAFGAHALKNKIEPSLLAAFKTGVQYQFIHSLALLMLGLLLIHVANQWLTAAGIAFIAGILLFSGSLYLMSVTGLKWLGIITPIGGVAFLIAWSLFIVGLLKAKI